MTDKAEARSTPFSGTATEGSTARTEAPTLTAGRALDIAIAEKVMGVPRRAIRVKGSTEYVTVWSDSPWFHDGQQLKTALQEYGKPRPYSTEIAAAWTIVEKLKAVGYEISVHNSWPYNDGRRWACDVITKGDGWKSAQAETPSEAICLAALKVPSALSQTEEGK